MTRTAGTNTSTNYMNLPSAEGLGSRLQRGAFWSILMMVMRNLVTVGGTAVLARVLTPEDFGIIGMVATLTGLLQSFSELGLSWSTLQSRELTKGQVDNLFWINGLVGAVIWAAAILLAGPLAYFYGEPRLQSVVVVMASVFFISGFAVQPNALMKRTMRFRAFSIVVIFATLFGVLVGIAAALAGLGYWALVLQSIATQTFRLVGALWVTGYRPGRITKGAGTFRLLKFGGYLAIVGIMTFAARNMDNVIVGRQGGPSELGFYTRAYFLVSLPTALVANALTGVMIPALSGLAEEAQTFERTYHQVLQKSAALIFPMVMGLAAVSGGMIRFVYGPQWEPVIPLLVALTGMGIALPILDSFAWLYIAKGEVRAYFRYSSAAALGYVLAFMVGSRWGGLGVAIAASVITLIMTFGPALIVSHRATKISVAGTLRTLVHPLVWSGLMALTAFFVGEGLDRTSLNWFASMCCQVATGVVVYGFFIIRFGGVSIRSMNFLRV